MRRQSGICSATTGQQPSEPQRIDVATLLALNAASEEAAQAAREAETHICGGTARAETETETEAAGASDRSEAGARMGETSNSSADPSGRAAEGGAQAEPAWGNWHVNTALRGHDVGLGRAGIAVGHLRAALAAGGKAGAEAVAARNAARFAPPAPPACALDDAPRLEPRVHAPLGRDRCVLGAARVHRDRRVGTRNVDPRSLRVAHIIHAGDDGAASPRRVAILAEDAVARGRVRDGVAAIGARADDGRLRAEPDDTV